MMDGIRSTVGSVIPLHLETDSRGKELYLNLVVVVCSHSTSDCEENGVNNEKRTDNHRAGDDDGSHNSQPIPE